MRVGQVLVAEEAGATRRSTPLVIDILRENKRVVRYSFSEYSLLSAGR